MKKIILLISCIILIIAQSCVSPYPYQTKYQKKSAIKFQKKKRKYYSIKKRTHYYHPTVKRGGKKAIKQKYREDRFTTTNY